MTRRVKPGIYPGMNWDTYAALDAVNSTTLRQLRFGPRACWHHRRFGTVVTKSMRDGSLAHIQILAPHEWLTRVVEWKEPVLEPLPALKWEKVDKGRYETACGSYTLELVLGTWHIAVEGGLLPTTPASVTAAKAACKEHYERTAERRPKLDADGLPKLAPQNKHNAAYKAFLAANPGREPVTRKELAAAKAVAAAVRDNPEARAALTNIWGTEVSIVWKDPVTGVLCKGRLDWLTDPADFCRITIGDLKLCRDHAPPGFPRAAASYEYHAQLAWYRAGLREAVRLTYSGTEEIDCQLLAVQSTGCHDSTVYTLDEDELRAGDELNAERLQEYLGYLNEYGDEPWPGKCWRAPLNLAEHAPWVLEGDDSEAPKLDWSNDDE